MNKSELIDIKHAFISTGIFVLAYIPVVIFLTPIRAWFPMGLMGSGLGLCIFLMAFYLEHGDHE